jgi:hypothetical protein
VHNSEPRYAISSEDSSPIVIGGIGGSGTRLITRILRDQGVALSGDLNEALDNLWFSLLFVRRTILLKSQEEIQRLAWLFTNAMRKGLPIPADLRGLLDEAARFDRGPALDVTVLKQSLASILVGQPSPDASILWAWKQPNSHIMVPMLQRCFPTMKYIYVERSGLDMAFSGNQNQLKYFWGDLLLDGDTSPSPRNALRYWVACHKRMLEHRALLGDRLYILNYDLFCQEPLVQLALLNEFLGLEVSTDKFNLLAGEVSPPASKGRHKRFDCDQLRLDDVEFVKAMGYFA